MSTKSKPPFLYSDRLIEFARSLRKTATKQEKHLWYDFLKYYQLHFVRQKPIGPFIADFFCKEASLVIELDGGQHNTPEGEEYDNKRSRYLRDLGLEVLRFWNMDVDGNFSGVCEAIDVKCREKCPEKFME